MIIPLNSYVLTSLIPSLLHIRLVGIEKTAVRVMVVGFHIGFLCQPALDRPSSQADAPGDFLDFHPLLAQGHHVLVALIPLRLMS